MLCVTHLLVLYADISSCPMVYVYTRGNYHQYYVICFVLLQPRLTHTVYRKGILHLSSRVVKVGMLRTRIYYNLYGLRIAYITQKMLRSLYVSALATSIVLPVCIKFLFCLLLDRNLNVRRKGTCPQLCLSC